MQISKDHEQFIKITIFFSTWILFEAELDLIENS